MSWASHRPQKVATWKSGKGESRSLGSSGFVNAENFPLGKNSLAMCKAKLPTAAPSPRLCTSPAVGRAVGERSHRGQEVSVILALNEPRAQGELSRAEGKSICVLVCVAYEHG